jgi:3-deoxy-manno-octulosonate cytidylyltransferase (CMP-KDO synthetase)
MNIVAVIPSRYGSSRFRGKSLVKIEGVSMIERVYRQVLKSQKFKDIIVATDDKRIEKVVNDFGGQAVITSEDHQSGTDRIWEVVQEKSYEGVINIQGDEPLVSDQLIAELYDMLATGKFGVVTAAHFNSSYNDFLSHHINKVVLGNDSRALYFSRSPIPFMEKPSFSGFYQHIGIYGYQIDALKAFVRMPASTLEKIEKLEQLRFLENDINIQVLQTEYRSIGVDVPADVETVEKILRGEYE